MTSAFITKYALTAGIQERKVQKIEDGMLTAVVPGGLNGVQYFHGEGREWHRTIEGAKDWAEKMRIKRISSLRKQIAALEKMEF
jgi:hypothetical protein